MFYKQISDGYRQVMKGVSMKTLVHGEKTLFAEFKLAAGDTIPMHAHEQEQTGYMISGSFLLTIGDETFNVGTGDSWCIPGNVQHGVQIIKDSIVIEVFSPVRKDYLPGPTAL